MSTMFWSQWTTGSGYYRELSSKHNFRQRFFVTNIDLVSFVLRSQLRRYIKLELVAGPYVLFYLSLVVGRAIS